MYLLYRDVWQKCFSFCSTNTQIQKPGFWQCEERCITISNSFLVNRTQRVVAYIGPTRYLVLEYNSSNKFTPFEFYTVIQNYCFLRFLQLWYWFMLISKEQWNYFAGCNCFQSQLIQIYSCAVYLCLVYKFSLSYRRGYKHSRKLQHLLIVDCNILQIWFHADALS